MYQMEYRLNNHESYVIMEFVPDYFGDEYFGFCEKNRHKIKAFREVGGPGKPQQPGQPDQQRVIGEQ